MTPSPVAGATVSSAATRPVESATAASVSSPAMHSPLERGALHTIAHLTISVRRRRALQLARVIRAWRSPSADSADFEVGEIGVAQQVVQPLAREGPLDRNSVWPDVPVRQPFAQTVGSIPARISSSQRLEGDRGWGAAEPASRRARSSSSRTM